uniref:Uncharacterized protein n=1 Tax=Rhizochromulina marina TaxID=1034831 RepID=A0A7S2ST37_9STRA|mmetsp:Transcript_5848/g.17074  ORF Transcript_5848/g.17074 Transcript_5848/m.17074 type:complete len:158 (+) Transcript_5848:16-489(+)
MMRGLLLTLLACVAVSAKEPNPLRLRLVNRGEPTDIFYLERDVTSEHFITSLSSNHETVQQIFPGSTFTIRSKDVRMMITVTAAPKGSKSPIILSFHNMMAESPDQAFDLVYSGKVIANVLPRAPVSQNIYFTNTFVVTRGDHKFFEVGLFEGREEL